MKLGLSLGRSMVAVVPAALLAAAASTGVAAASTHNFNSCSVVTRAEAQAAIGEKVSAGVLGHATVEGGSACVFFGPSSPSRDPNMALPDEVRVAVVQGSNALKWFKDYKAKTKVSAKAISGYGNQAFWDGYASLSVLKGNFYMRIAVSPANAAPSLKDEEKLAKAILPKL